MTKLSWKPAVLSKKPSALAPSRCGPALFLQELCSADGKTGETSRPTQELERSGIGATDGLQFAAALGKGIGHICCLAQFGCQCDFIPNI